MEADLIGHRAKWKERSEPGNMSRKEEEALLFGNPKILSEDGPAAGVSVCEKSTTLT